MQAESTSPFLTARRSPPSGSSAESQSASGPWRTYPFAFGFFVSLMLFQRKEREEPEWEEKYHDLLGKYRDLTRQLNENSGGEITEKRLSRYRQTLWDVRGMLMRPENLTSDRAQTAVTEIDDALKL